MCVIFAIIPKLSHYLESANKEMLINCPGPYWIINGEQETHGEDLICDIQLDNEEWIMNMAYDLFEIKLKDYSNPELDTLIEKYQACLELIVNYDSLKKSLAIVYENCSEMLSTIDPKKEAVKRIADRNLKLIKSNIEALKADFPDKIYRVALNESFALYDSSRQNRQAFFVNRENAEKWLAEKVEKQLKFPQVKRRGSAEPVPVIQEILIADINKNLQ